MWIPWLMVDFPSTFLSIIHIIQLDVKMCLQLFMGSWEPISELEAHVAVVL